MNIKNIHILYTIIFSLCFESFIILATPAYAQDEFKLRPGAKGTICLKCHESFQQTLANKFLHPLVKRRECTGCHVPHASSHKGLLTADTTKLCYNCHQAVLPENRRSAHAVVVEGNCTACHASHGSDNKFILTKSGNELCFECHKDFQDSIKNVRFKHRSLERGKGCLNCHNPHASAKANFLLERDPPALCIKCHETGKSTFRWQHKNYPVTTSDCTSCHNPHGSNNRGIIFDVAHAAVTEGRCVECHQEPGSLKTKKQTTQLCRECHQDMVTQTFNKNRVHWPLVDNVGCLNCHSPHASRHPKLVKGSLVETCGKCHADTVALQEVSKKNPKNKKLCEPVRTGNCTACHSPHGSNNVLLIDQPSISIDLCGRCHEWQTHSTHPIGEKTIDPRDKNLSVECLSCHKACGTANNPAMLPFSSTYELCIQCHTERRR